MSHTSSSSPLATRDAAQAPLAPSCRWLHLVFSPVSLEELPALFLGTNNQVVVTTMHSGSLR